MAIKQKNREIAIETPLGEDVLLLVSVSGTEPLSRPFEFHLELASETQQVKTSDIVGQNVTIRLNLPKDKVRYFNGYISCFTQAMGALGLNRYRATFVPWLWFLTRTADCRIFQNMIVPDIIKEVFKDHGFTDFEDALTGSYRKWENCVQYRETDFNFVSRLMEQEGIYYFFKHEKGKHSLVLADSASAHEPFPEFDQLKFQPADLRSSEEKYITDWIVDTYVQPGFYALNDFDFKNTKKDLQVRAKVSREHAISDYEIYDYPGEYIESKDGQEYAKKRIQELHSQYEVISAESDIRGICTGYTFTLTDHPFEDQNKKYLITSTNHRAQSDILNPGGFQGDSEYSCSFTAIDTNQSFRAARITPKPTIPGPQTAMVVGPSGEEIYTDEFSRVKVQFHWDRYGKADENSSCWIRVSQAWAGKKWGAIYIPRIGQEVIVEFLEGDPDQPIITGRVYNGQAMPPYELPAEKTKSTLKSDSSKGGGGFNEIRFEDKKDSEQIFVHAQKDRDIEVENNETHWIGNDRQKTVDRDETTNIKRDRTETVDRDESITIGENRTESVGKNENITISENRTESVGKNEDISVGENRKVKVGKNDEQQIGKKYALIAGDQIQLQTGKASLIMKKDGTIQIKGKDITISGSGKINIKASSDVNIKGSKVKNN